MVLVCILLDGRFTFLAVTIEVSSASTYGKSGYRQLVDVEIRVDFTSHSL